MGATVIGCVLVILWMTPAPKANAKSLSQDLSFGEKNQNPLLVRPHTKNGIGSVVCHRCGAESPKPTASAVCLRRDFPLWPNEHGIAKDQASSC
jgi:hypothetical protein